MFDASGRLEGFRRIAIHKNGEEGGGYKGVDLVDPLIAEAKLSYIFFMKSQLSLSEAFDKSNLINMPTFLLALREWIIS